MTGTNRFLDNYYQMYIRSDAWEQRRQILFALRGKVCEVCRNPRGPHQVHHLSYENLGSEPLSDLKVLCSRCHRDVEKLHYKMGRRTDRRVVFSAFKAANLRRR